MNRMRTTTHCLGAALGLTALCLATAAGLAPAQAESVTIPYSCVITELHGDGDTPPQPLSDPHLLEVRLDSALQDGSGVPVGTTVELAPVSGSFTFSTELVAAIRDYGVDAGSADAVVDTYVMGKPGREGQIVFEGEPFIFPTDSAVTVRDTGTAPAYRVDSAGHHTLAFSKSLFMTLAEADLNAYLSCEAPHDVEPAIDSVRGVAMSEGTPEPTPTATPAPSPSRPSLVQTDAAQPTSPTWQPLAAAGAGSILVLGAASQLARRHPGRQ